MRGKRPGDWSMSQRVQRPVPHWVVGMHADQSGKKKVETCQGGVGSGIQIAPPSAGWVSNRCDIGATQKIGQADGQDRADFGRAESSDSV